MEPFINNVFDTALVLEGGGMRASYTAGAINALLENEIYFDYVSGISAGSTNLVNYLARMPQRSYRSFVDLADDPQFGGMNSLLRGKGLFNMHHIYYEAPQPGNLLEFSWERFQANPARWRIGAYNAQRGLSVYFTEKMPQTIHQISHLCRASSSMPLLTPPTCIAQEMYLDGAIGPSGGIPLDIAKQDGFTKFVVLLTRPRGYRKSKSRAEFAYPTLLRRYPLAAQALLDRKNNYNRSLAELEQLSASGNAFVFYADEMMVENYESDSAKLAQNFSAGYQQMRQQMHSLREFLGL